MDYFLSVEDLHKSHRRHFWSKPTSALAGVSLGFPAGTATAIFGHNGAGKTTTIRAILGIVGIDKGIVTFDGRPITVSARKRIGYMPETNRLPQLLTPEEILGGQMAVMGVAGSRARLEEVLRQVGLWDNRRKQVRALSKGMGRRLAWAQATIHRPAFIILDEPFSGLDPLGRMQLDEWIAEEKARGTTIIMATHEVEMGLGACDRYYVMKNGKVVLASDQDTGGTDFIIAVSGLEQTQLAAMASGEGLPPWDGMERSGHVSHLYFSDYSVAASWLAALARSPAVIVDFSCSELFTKKQLLELFDPQMP